MKKALITVSLAAITAFAAQDAVQIAKESMQKLGPALQSELRQKMQKDPTGLKAIEYCADQAQIITDEVNEKLPQNVTIKRTALKYRNEANEPTIRDIEVMRNMKRAIEEWNYDADEMIEVVEDGDKTYVYKPLTVGNSCFRCHGDASEMDSDLADAIAQRFPYDRAINFAKGDFRGTIVTIIEN